MTGLTFILRTGAVAASLAAALPATAQIAPGMRPPTSMSEAAGHAWSMGCFFAASERPAPGLNLPVASGGPDLREPDAIPDDLRPLIMAMPNRIVPALLNAPGGAIWMFYDPQSHRCMVVPSPVDAPGLQAELETNMALMEGWTTVTGAAGAPAGATVYEQTFPAAPSLRRPAATLRVWYQPAAGPESPQMIVTERVAERRRRR